MRFATPQGISIVVSNFYQYLKDAFDVGCTKEGEEVA